MTTAKAPRDPLYDPPPNWSKLYKKHFPKHTDATSRHVKVICEGLRKPSNPMRVALHNMGYEPDHMAESMENTVKMLWEARQRIAELEAELAKDKKHG